MKINKNANIIKTQYEVSKVIEGYFLRFCGKVLDFFSDFDKNSN